MAALVGVGLVVVILALSQVNAAGAADEVVAGASPVVTERGLQRMRADLERAKSVSEALQGNGLERLAALSGEPRDELLAEVRQRYPQFSESLQRLPAVQKLADTVVGNLERRLREFESAEALPGLGLSLRDAVWAQLVLAAVLIALGVAGLLRPRRVLAVAVLVIGVLLVALPLALGYPAKAADADALLDSLRPFSTEKVEAREQGLATARRVFDGFREDVVPFVAERSGTTPDEVLAELEESSPALSTANLDETGAMLDRFGALVVFSRRIQPDLVEADTISATTGMWLLIAPGAALALAGAIGLAAAGPRRELEA